jgi:hypothetical protein
LLFIQNRAPVIEEMREVPRTSERSPSPAAQPQTKANETQQTEQALPPETPNLSQSQPSGIVDSGHPGTDEILEPAHPGMERSGLTEVPPSTLAGPSGASKVPRAHSSTRRPHEECIVCDTAHQGSSHSRLTAEDTNLWALVSASRRSTGGDDEVEEIPRPRPSSPPFKAAYMNGEELQAAIDEAAEKTELEEFARVSNRSVELMEVQTCQLMPFFWTNIITSVSCCSVFLNAQESRRPS